MRAVVGFDIATKRFAWSVVSVDSQSFIAGRTVSLARLDDGQLHQVTSTLREEMVNADRCAQARGMDIVLHVTEGVFYSQSKKVACDLGHMAGMVQATAAVVWPRIAAAMPKASEVRSTLGIPRTKVGAAQAMLELYPQLHNEREDTIDAAACALWGARVLEVALTSGDLRASEEPPKGLEPAAGGPP